MFARYDDGGGGRVSFEGTVDGVGLPVFGMNPAIGTTVSGSFSYDTAAAPTTAGSFYAAYQVQTPYALVAYINGNRIESGGTLNLSLQNNFGGNVEDTLDISGSPAMINGTPTADGVFALSFASHNAATFGSLLLPEQLVLSDFDAWHYGVITRSGNNSEIINFTITSLTPVPLPAAALLFGSGLAGLAVVGLRRIRSALV